MGLVTGGAAEIVEQASREGLSAYITGEGANHHYHEAIEGHCVLIFAGHYATETGGVKAVGNHLDTKIRASPANFSTIQRAYNNSRLPVKNP